MDTVPSIFHRVYHRQNHVGWCCWAHLLGKKFPILILLLSRKCCWLQLFRKISPKALMFIMDDYYFSQDNKGCKLDASPSSLRAIRALWGSEPYELAKVRPGSSSRGASCVNLSGLSNTSMERDIVIVFTC